MADESKNNGGEANNLHIFGELTPVEQEGLRRFRATSDELVRRIGLNRVEEARLLGQLNLVERQATSSLQEIGKRLGIPDGTAWSVTGNGQAIATPMLNQPEGG